MRYAGIIKNDVCAAPGVCVTFFVQGCPHRCKGCHNPEELDFNGGRKVTDDTFQELKSAINANGVLRNLCIMGGEPLCKENIELTHKVITEVLNEFPNLKVYLWTGYLYEDLLANDNNTLSAILSNVNVLIDGPFIEELRDITLFMRGSSNQRVIQLN